MRKKKKKNPYDSIIQFDRFFASFLSTNNSDLNKKRKEEEEEEEEEEERPTSL